jgi:hypothetical protein
VIRRTIGGPIGKVIGGGDRKDGRGDRKGDK